MPIILITGAASGLGLGFLDHYVQDSSNVIIAIDKNRAEVPASQSENRARVIFQILDITSEHDVLSFAEDIKKEHGISAIDLVIHCAGMRGLVPGIETTDPDSIARAESLDVMDSTTMVQTFQINCMATFIFFRALVPLLRGTSTGLPKVITMASRMGSVSYNSVGGGYAYRASKAALNAVIKSLSLDVKTAVWLAVHPGRVQTGLVKSFEPGAIAVEEAIEAMVTLIRRVEIADSGKFVDRWGNSIEY